MQPVVETPGSTGTPAPPAAPPEQAPVQLNLGNLRETVASHLQRAEPVVPAAPVAVPPAAEAAAPEAPVTPVEEEFSPEQLGEIPAAIIKPEQDLAALPADVSEVLHDDPAIQQLIEANPPLKQAWRHHKLASEFQKPWEQGGIGHVPTTEEARTYWNSHLAMENMREHFASEDPAQRAEWIRNWLAPASKPAASPEETERNNVAQAAANEVLRLQPQVLARVNPDGFRDQVNQYGLFLAETLYREAATLTDEPSRNRMLDAARMMEWKLTGKYRPVGSEAQRQPTPQEMEIERERLALTARERQLADQRRNQEQTQVQNLKAQTVSAQNSLLDSDVKKALGAALTGLEPDYRDYLIDKFKKQLRVDVDSDPHRKRLVLNRADEMARSGNMDGLVGHLQEYRRLYVQHLAKRASDFRREASVKRTDNLERQIPDAARAAQLATSANNLNPGGASARPTDPQIGVNGARERQPGESIRDYAARAVRASANPVG